MASTYLSRTNGTPTLSNKFTISVWVKRAELSSSGMNAICGSDSTGSHATQFFFDGPSLRFFDNYTSTDLVTNRKFRDTNAWYHIVAAIDTSQTTAADRVKIYVNGTQETSFATSNYPTQNTGMIFNINGYVKYIGTAETADGNKFGYFDGCMSHFHFVDGQQYDASVFGSTDATTGEWKINTSPTMTMGNNGFTILKDGNTITDQSSNSNNFTLGAGTLTQTEDCPSNNFATGNALYFTNTAWTTSLSNGNNTFTGHTGSNSYPMVASTLAATGGKFYAEFKVTSSSQNYYVGVATPEAVSGTAINAHYPNWNNEGGTNAHAYSYYGADGQKYVKTSGGSTSASAYGSSSSQNDILGVALDLDNNNLYIHKNGTYFNSGVPTSGSTGTGAISVVAHDYLFFMSDGGGGSDASGTANFGNGYFGTTAISSEGTNASGIGKFEYDVPNGYTALSTKGLNE
jgi:hypothetical protein